MKKLASLLVLFTAVLFLTGCNTDTNPCGEGTELVGDSCVLIDDSNDDINTGGTAAVSCENTTGLHSVPGGNMYSISSWLNWRFIGGHLVTDPDNAWIQSFGAAVFPM